MIDSAETLAKIADTASSAMTSTVADGVAARTTAAMSDMHAAAASALYQIKLRCENLEIELELRRKRALDEVVAFTAATSEILNTASTLGRVLDRFEKAVVG